MNQGFGKDFYRKGNSVKRFGPFSEPAGLCKLKSCCPHPLPKNQLLTLSLSLYSVHFLVAAKLLAPQAKFFYDIEPFSIRLQSESRSAKIGFEIWRLCFRVRPGERWIGRTCRGFHRISSKKRHLDSLRGSSDKIGTIQRRLAWPLRKDDTHKSGSVQSFIIQKEAQTKERQFFGVGGLLFGQFLVIFACLSHIEIPGLSNDLALTMNSRTARRHSTSDPRPPPPRSSNFAFLSVRSGKFMGKAPPQI